MYLYSRSLQCITTAAPVMIPEYIIQRITTSMRLGIKSICPVIFALLLSPCHVIKKKKLMSVIFLSQWTYVNSIQLDVLNLISFMIQNQKYVYMSFPSRCLEMDRNSTIVSNKFMILRQYVLDCTFLIYFICQHGRLGTLRIKHEYGGTLCSPQLWKNLLLQCLMLII